MPKKVKYTGAKYYNEKQIDALLSTVKDDVFEGIILLTLFYGLRRSEIMGLKWEAIDFENNILTIKHTVVQNANKIYQKDSTKNKSSYGSIPIPVVIKECLEKIKLNQTHNKLMQPNDYNETGYVLTKLDGTLINPNYVTKHFKNILLKNNLPVIRFHDLRHSAASYLLYLGFSMKEIQMWLRHGDIGTTMNIYTHMDMAAKTVIADSLNEKFKNFR